MILAILLFLTAYGAAQTNDARALLQDIASTARATESWRAEGVKVDEMTGNGISLYEEIHFKIAIQGPSKMRWETSGDDDTLMVCDGTDHWTYYRHGTSFYRNPVGVSPCDPALGDLSGLADNLKAALVTGRDTVQFSDGLRECDIVRAEYTLPGSPDGASTVRTAVRTLCVDASQRLIMRDSVEGTVSGVHSKGTITYNIYEREPKLSTDVFDFRAPTGTVQDENSHTGGDDTSVDVPPTLIYKVEPSYTEEAIKAEVSGTVLVSVAVGPNGKPENMRVDRGLGHGLDEKAIEAVGRWRFLPGTKDGAPVTVTQKFVVNFRLQ